MRKTTPAQKMGSVMKHHEYMRLAQNLLERATDSRPSPVGPEQLTVATAAGEVLVDVTWISQPRTELLRGALAQSVLRLFKHREGRPLVSLVGVERLGSRLRTAAAAYMREFAPEVGWGLFDADGGAHVDAHRQGIEFFRPSVSRQVPGLKSSTNAQPFTDLNRWLLKVLVAVDAGWSVVQPAERSWTARLGELLQASRHPANPSELSEAAGVSTAKAYRFAATFEELRLLDKAPLRVSRLERLLSDWLAVDRVRKDPRTPVRGLFGVELDRVLQDDDVLLGGFGALERLGLLHRSAVGRLELHTRAGLKELTARLDLEVCDEAVADFMVIQTKHAESVFRGAVFTEGPIVDPWQAALDVVGAEARGTEQAEHVRDWLLERVRTRGGRRDA